MRLKNTYLNECNEIEGIAFFPYFKKEITVVCCKGVTPEYAEFFLKDTLENTSVGELEDGEAFSYVNPLDLLQYFSFNTLYIDEPPEFIDQSSEINVLNLSGSCDWREDDGIQCLVKNGEVLYLGDFEVLNVWSDHSKNYYGNYVLYENLCEKRRTWRKLTVEEAREIDVGRTQRFFDHWNAKDRLKTHKLKKFVDILASKEKLDFKNAIEVLEDSYMYQLMNEYPQLLEESIDFWYECFCIEKEKDIGELMAYICENIQWDMF